MGHQVGVVTNDQAEDLVDTQTFRSQGVSVEEIPGACFCCSFNSLTDAVERLSQSDRPDTILGEPVGSCTDLVATVVQPLKHLYGDRYVVTPLVTLLDPHRAEKILTRAPKGGFSPKAAYIYEKQLEEADVIAINKIDSLSTEERENMIQLIEEKYPGKPVLCVSARTGEGFDDLVETFVVF